MSNFFLPTRLWIFILYLKLDLQPREDNNFETQNWRRLVWDSVSFLLSSLSHEAVSFCDIWSILSPILLLLFQKGSLFGKWKAVMYPFHRQVLWGRPYEKCSKATCDPMVPWWGRHSWSCYSTSQLSEVLHEPEYYIRTVVKRTYPSRIEPDTSMALGWHLNSKKVTKRSLFIHNLSLLM